MRQLDRCALRWVLLSSGDNGGQWGCVGGSSYLGVHVNQRACLLRAGELRGKGSVSPASSEETRQASWLRAQICQFGQTGRYVYGGGKGQEKCVLINSAGGGIQGGRKKKSGKKSAYCCQTKYFTTLEGITTLQRGKKNHKISTTSARGVIYTPLISHRSLYPAPRKLTLTALWTKTGTLMNFMTFSLLHIHAHFQLLNSRGRECRTPAMKALVSAHDRDILFLHQKAGISFLPLITTDTAHT